MEPCIPSSLHSFEFFLLEVHDQFASSVQKLCLSATQYRPKEGELPVIAPELTSELLHCLSMLPDPWPLAKITIDMEKPSQWVSKMCRLFFADEYARRTVGVPTAAQVPDLEPAFKAAQNILPNRGKNYRISLRVASDFSHASKACVGHQSTPPLFHVLQRILVSRVISGS